MIAQIEAADAAQVLDSDSDAIYLDVRTEEEFLAAHPAGAWNVPVLFFDKARQTHPNPEFAQVIEANFRKDQMLVIGCRSGVRSMRAGHILESLGYTSLANVSGGFAGGRDSDGRAIVGWRDSGLPVEERLPEDRCYDALKAKT
jgi:rhodanese-related sulfurtransferase